MKIIFIVLSFSLWIWNFAQERILLQYDYQKIENQLAHYSNRITQEIEQIRGARTLNSKIEIQQKQERSFKNEEKERKVSILFQGLIYDFQFETILPAEKGKEEATVTQFFRWNSAYPKQIHSSEAGDILLGKAPAKIKKRIERNQILLQEKLTFSTTKTGKINQFSWPSVTKENQNNFRNSWVLLPAESVALGDSWEQTFQEELGGLGTLEVKITYFLKEITKESPQVAIVEGILDFKFNDATARRKIGATCKLSDEFGKIKLKFDLEKGIVVELFREIKATLKLEIPTEGTEKMVIISKVQNRFEERLELLKENQ